MVTIYALVDPITKEIKYVGCTTQSLKKRLSHHSRFFNYKNGTKSDKKMKWCEDLFKQNLKPEIFELDRCSEADKIILENYWIAQFKAWNFNLLNQKWENDSFFEKSKRKQLSKNHLDKLKGRKISEESRLKCKTAAIKRVEKRFGLKPIKKEASVKWLNSMKEFHKNCSEHLEKIRLKKKTKKVLQMDEDGNILKTWNSVTEVANFFNCDKSSIRHVIIGTRQRSQGFKWKYE